MYRAPLASANPVTQSLSLGTLFLVARSHISHL
jgi:hypothetical protein